MNRWAVLPVAVVSVIVVSASSQIATVDGYLDWPLTKAEGIAASTYKRGRVGSFLGDRGPLQTERAENYKLAATLFSPAVVQATARVIQLRSRLSSQETLHLIGEANKVDGTVVMVELDPREGSGVIPLDWEAFLQPKGQPDLAVKGVNTPDLRELRLFAGVLRRNYDYDRFWVVFPAGPDAPYRKSGVVNVQLVVRIRDQEGRVDWPASVLGAR